jgi:transmembrane sensor
MTKINEYQEYLLIGKITGSLTPEEEREFQELFDNNPDVQFVYDDLKSKLPPEEVENSFADLRQADEWKDLGGAIRKKRKKKIINYVTLSATAVLIIIGAIWYNSPERQKNIAVGGNAKIIDNPIQLRLASGEQINLSGKKEVIETSSVTLNTTNNSLEYSTGNNELAGLNSLTVPDGVDYKIVLSDGSKVWLNSATRLEFPLKFSGQKREIRISGEAYFEIAKNKDKPFIVHLPNSTVEVTGTEFNINTYDSGVNKVSLVTGSVNMMALSDSIRLSPGQEGEVNFRLFRKNKFNPQQTLSWKHGLYYFKDADLQYLGKIVKRIYGIKVTIDGKDLLNKKYTGVFDKRRSVEDFINDLKNMSGIAAFFDKEGILHLK